MIQDISYSPVLLKHYYDEEEDAPATQASLKCFAAFPKLRYLSINMGPMSPWVLQLDAALEGNQLHLPLYHTHIHLCF